MRILGQNHDGPGGEDGVPSEIEVELKPKRPMVPDALALLDALAAIQETQEGFGVDVVVKALHTVQEQPLEVFYIETLRGDTRSVWVYEIQSGVLSHVRTGGPSPSTEVVYGRLVSNSVNAAYGK